MGIFDAAVMAMSRAGDAFDCADGLIVWLERQLAAVPDDELLLEWHGGDLFGCLHVYDPRRDMVEQLRRAHELIREAELIFQTVLAALP